MVVVKLSFFTSFPQVISNGWKQWMEIRLNSILPHSTCNMVEYFRQYRFPLLSKLNMRRLGGYEALREKTSSNCAISKLRPIIW
jgi:hypothetical protein